MGVWVDGWVDQLVFFLNDKIVILASNRKLTPHTNEWI